MELSKESGILHRSFARRIGKALSSKKRSILDNELHDYMYNIDKIESVIGKKKISMEIGCGNGDHFLHLLNIAEPDDYFIGVEAYVNGIADILCKKEHHKNFCLWPDDVDLILENLPVGAIHKIFILFPDPWSKRRQHKRRLLNRIRINYFHSMLIKGGSILFASDIEEYYKYSILLFQNDPRFTIKELEMGDIFQTKYYTKALRESRKVNGFKAYKN